MCVCVYVCVCVCVCVCVYVCVYFLWKEREKLNTFFQLFYLKFVNNRIFSEVHLC